ncbi:hypothetical protein DKX38_027479 [Salix brachista]|uniref:Uncharacterized protein n=1 Tax=Salix brachista TaxID=2182728 RepID=A0A5N5JC86_9ROSI|nr:hypothetical protein DKX38_027479 [Salix brachista]
MLAGLEFKGNEYEVSDMTLTEQLVRDNQKVIQELNAMPSKVCVGISISGDGVKEQHDGLKSQEEKMELNSLLFSFPVSKSPLLQPFMNTCRVIPRKAIYFALMIPTWTSRTYRPATLTTNKAIPRSCVDVKPFVSSIPHHVAEIQSNSPIARAKVKRPATSRSEQASLMAVNNVNNTNSTLKYLVKESMYIE